VISPGQVLNTAFTVKILAGGGPQEVPFAALLTRPTIVSIYMRNNTPGCDRQVASLLKAAAEFERAGYNLLAISRDTIGSHVRYATARSIGFTLVSDPGDRFAQAAGALVQKSMYGRTFVGPARCAFVIEPGGKVLAVQEKVKPADHGAELRRLMDGLKGVAVDQAGTGR